MNKILIKGKSMSKIRSVNTKNTIRNIERVRKTAQTRSNPVKPNNFKNRNYIREYDENGRIVKELNDEGRWVVAEPKMRPRKVTKAQKKVIEQEERIKELRKQISSNKLERSSKGDYLDFSTEDKGYFTRRDSNGKILQIIETFFPR